MIAIEDGAVIMGKTKRCSLCKKHKDILLFSKSKKNKDNLQNGCKKCLSDSRLKYVRTKEGLISSIYSHQKMHSHRRKHLMPTYSVDDLKDFALNDTNFNNIYEKWVESNYKKQLRPSIDRIDDKKSYSIENIQIMTWKENDIKGGYYKSKPVNQLSKDGVFIQSFVSIKEAGKKLSLTQSPISRCCTGAQKTAHGFKWEFNKKG